MGKKDIISKQVIRQLAADMAKYLLGLDVEVEALELLETESRRIEDRRADLVARVRPSGDETPFVLHIEIQNDNDSDMPWRMLRYRTDIALAHADPPVHQYLIFIGKARLTMPNHLRRPDIDFRYSIRDMHQIDCQSLLAHDSPDALVLAVLCDFGEREPQSVVNQIFLRLKQLVGDDHKRLREYIDMIEVLSENRNLKPLLKKAEKMLTQVDVTKLPSYELGMEAGMEAGKKAGIEQGKNEGSLQTKLAVARNLLSRMTDEEIAECAGLAIGTVRQLRVESGC